MYNAYWIVFIENARSHVQMVNGINNNLWWLVWKKKCVYLIGPWYMCVGNKRPKIITKFSSLINPDAVGF